MQSAVKTKQRTRSDIKIAQEQATLKTISVIQTTIQCGIAQVCFSRNLFPTSFFRHVDIGIGANGSQNGDSIVVFDLDDPESHSHTQAHSGGEIFLHGQENSSSGSGSEGSRSGPGPESMEKDSQESNLPFLSPLTSDFNYPASGNMNSQLQMGTGACSGTDVFSSDAIMKAEVRLLLHWVRGLWDILSDDVRRSSLMRVVFGICKPGGQGKDGTVGDRVLESFAVSQSGMSFWQCGLSHIHILDRTNPTYAIF